MLAASAICIRPILNSCNIPIKIFDPKLPFPRKSVSVKSVSSEKEKGFPKRMTGFNGSCDSSTGDESMRAFEQEALINESTSFSNGEFEATLNSLSKWVVAALFGGLLLWRHDAEALWAAMGSVLNAGLSSVLKRILNQERPVSALKKDPGMPSSHSQSIFYTVTFAIMSMVEWFGLNGFTTAFSAVILAFGAYFSWLRVSQQLHTVSQVVVGAIVGSLVSFLWFWSWDAIVLDAFVSYLWVRIIVILGAVGFCLAFLVYVIRYWVMEDQ